MRSPGMTGTARSSTRGRITSWADRGSRRHQGVLRGGAFLSRLIGTFQERMRFTNTSGTTNRSQKPLFPQTLQEVHKVKQQKLIIGGIVIAAGAIGWAL